MTKTNQLKETLDFWINRTERVDDCLVWTGAVSTDGYARSLYRNNPNGKVHRIVYGLANPQEDITGKLIRHTCDNTLCINPAHLEAGSPADNMLDRDTRGRGRADKTHNEVRAIRTLWETGDYTQTELARLFNTQQGSIRQIVMRTAYKYVE